jgi:leucyl aminopeptidase
MLPKDLDIFVPEAYRWLEKEGSQVAQNLQAGAIHVLPVKFDADGRSSIASAVIAQDVQAALKQQAERLGFQPKSTPLILAHGDYSFLLVPRSPSQQSAVQVARDVGLKAAYFLSNYKVQQVLCLDAEGLEAWDVWEGIVQGLFRCTAFQGEKRQKALPPLVKLGLVSTHANDREAMRRVSMMQSMVLSRNLAEAPPNRLNSERLADLTVEMFKPYKGVKVTVKGRSEIEALGMGSFASVAKGTKVDPKLIVIEIPGADTKKTVALVGKGLTFDSGGICLKPAKGMEEMKYDMCGGAEVLGSALYFAKVQPPCNVVCLVGAVENMPFNEATRPGDVVTAMNGKTIEIINTDAEGRLVLADLLHYARITYNPRYMIDVATLTGAVVVALGHTNSGLFSNSLPLRQFVEGIAQQVGAPVWPMPICPEHEPEILSTVADLKNITSEKAGAKSSTAASFLQQFVGDTPWAHIDIAGTAWDCQALGHPGRGPSGYSMRTLIRACEMHAEFL